MAILTISLSLIAGLLGAWTSRAPAASTQRELRIISKFDNFGLVLKGASGFVDGKPADLSTFKDLTAIINNPLGTACPSFQNQKPDVTVSEGAKVRSIYIQMGVVSDGKNCMSVGGEGLYYFPLHRDFLIGSKSDGLALKSPIKIFRQGVKLVELNEVNGRWQAETSDLLINWEFIRKFQSSLKRFKIENRINMDLAANRPKMIVRSGGETYEFFKLTDIMWALKRPESNWLVASDDWSFWGDFDRKQIEDPFSESIRFLLDAQVTDQQKKKNAMDSLEGVWSQNLRELYHKMALNPDESMDLRLLSLKRLRRKPAPSSAGVALQLLESTRDSDIEREAFALLRVQNPKGPKLRPKMSENNRAQVLAKWRAWWNQLPNKND